MVEQQLTWRKRQEFTLSVIGYVVGLGNVVYFPRLAHKNGGVVFVIPYVIAVMFVGLPMMMLELSLGQFCSRGITKCWGFSKIFSGIGISCISSLIPNLLTYNLLIAWAIYYFGASFTSFNQPENQLPWVCNNKSDWYSAYSTCRLNMSFPENATLCTSLDYFDGGNGVCYKNANLTVPYAYTDLSFARRNESLRPIVPSEDYFGHVVNHKAESPEGAGQLNALLIICLFAAWALVFACVCKGIKSIGKVVYVTATVPYIILLVMIIYGAFLQHSTDCLLEFLTPRFGRLKDPQVWQDATIQALYSLSIGIGGLITLSAYNDFSNNTFKSTLIVVAVDTVTSLVATVAVFMYLGVLSHDINVGSCDVIKDDPYLAFHVFPYAVTKLPLPPLWAILFFFMMIMLGLDSLIGDVETIVGSIIETWKPTLGSRIAQVHLYACITLFLCSLILASSTGLYWFEMLSKYAFTWNKLVIVFLICIALSWFYGAQKPYNVCGADRFLKDIEIMIGPRQCCFRWRKLGAVFEPFWRVIIPAGFLVVLANMLYTWDNLGLWWLDLLGWSIAAGSLLPIPIAAILHVARAPGKTMSQKLQSALKPTTTWGPTLYSDRLKVDYVPGFLLDQNDIEMIEPGKSRNDTLTIGNFFGQSGGPLVT